MLKIFSRKVSKNMPTGCACLAFSCAAPTKLTADSAPFPVLSSNTMG
ncbi:hypothetical protein HMPREF9431_00053 [Segatella oulorum F0390]|uniref:Lipoprotein n=1 Tax=Segatella oulorum F0390 TaxID=702438 RepID=G1W8A2_9BACT|nr:hypothetical protein HMPREF9431_00053 [Segatella oulorum F0390]